MRGKKKDGGGVVMKDEAPSTSYTPPNNVEKEAKSKAKGGAVKDCKPDGPMKAKRGDRPGRKLGGRVGADKAPLSSAANSSAPPGRSIS